MLVLLRHDTRPAIMNRTLRFFRRHDGNDIDALLIAARGDEPLYPLPGFEPVPVGFAGVILLHEGLDVEAHGHGVVTLPLAGLNRIEPCPTARRQHTRLFFA